MNCSQNKRARSARLLTALPALLLVGSLLTAQAQSAPAAPLTAETADLVYDLYQFGNPLGDTGMTLQRTPEGTTARSYVSVAGLLDVADVLTASPDGSATSYRLSGTAQGAPFRLEVSFTDAGADLTIEQGGATHNIALPSETPFYVFDNNFLDGYQIAADQVLAAGSALTFSGIVPQTALAITVGLDAPQPSSVDYRGSTVQATRIDGKLNAGPQSIDLTLYLDAAGDILVFEQEAAGVRFVRRGTDATVAADEVSPVQAALAEYAACLVERDLGVTSEGASLKGKLTLPLSATQGKPAPTLLLLPGSGAVDMNGNAAPLIANSSYQQLAYQLACNGYGVLRSAKLGIAPSSGDGNAVTLGTYAANAAAWLELLSRQPGVAPDKLAVMGHSEGGLIALYAVAQGLIDPAAVVLIAAPGRTMADILREQLVASLQRSGISGDALTQMTDQIDEALQAIRNVDGPTLDLTGDLQGNQFAASFAPAAGLLKSELDQNPAELAASVTAPTVVLQGLKDIQVLQVDGRNLAAALPNATLLEFPNLAHGMHEVAGAPLQGALPAPDTVISGTLVRALTTWLDGHLRIAR